MANNWMLYDEGAGRNVAVKACNDAEAWEKIEPDMIYNRLDLIREEPSGLLLTEIQGGDLASHIASLTIRQSSGSGERA